MVVGGTWKSNVEKYHKVFAGEKCIVRLIDNQHQYNGSEDTTEKDPFLSYIIC